VLAAALLAAWGSACDNRADGERTGITPPLPPSPPPSTVVVDSAAPARLEVQDTVRFSAVFQHRVPSVRLVDLRGRALDAAGVTWQSESESVVGVLAPPRFGEFSLFSRAEGATRVIATVERAGAAPLVDTLHVVVARVLTRLTLERFHEGLVVEQEAAAGLDGRDSANTPRALPDSLRAQVRWTSSSPSVATVDASGRVRAVGQGTAVLQAELPSLGLRDTMTVAVLRPYPLPNEQVHARTSPGPGNPAFVAAPDGSTLYVIETSPRATLTLVAVSPDGAVRWRRIIGSNVRSLSSGRDGAVYFPDGSLLRGYSRDGQELFPAGLPCGSGFALDADGGIYCARSDSVVAYTAAGAPRWARPGAGAQAVVLGPGRVYGFGRGITALTHAGEPLWQKDVEGGVGAVDAEGALYVSHPDRSLSAVAPDGRTRWQVPDVPGGMAIAPGGTLVVVETGGRRMVSALRTADGVGRWRVFNESMIPGGFPHVGDDGRLYVASNCHVHVFELGSGDILGRTPDRQCAYAGTSFLPNRLYLADFGTIRVVTLAARPGSEWSQIGGNAGRMRTTQ
jgi:hypothetical protein